MSTPRARHVHRHACLARDALLVTVADLAAASCTGHARTACRRACVWFPFHGAGISLCLASSCQSGRVRRIGPHIPQDSVLQALPCALQTGRSRAPCNAYRVTRRVCTPLPLRVAGAHPLVKLLPVLFRWWRCEAAHSRVGRCGLPRFALSHAQTVLTSVRLHAAVHFAVVMTPASSLRCRHRRMSC